nr:hypothetical protein [Natronohydrobacter thiooxidans]
MLLLVAGIAQDQPIFSIKKDKAVFKRLDRGGQSFMRIVRGGFGCFGAEKAFDPLRDFDDDQNSTAVWGRPLNNPQPAVLVEAELEILCGRGWRCLAIRKPDLFLRHEIGEKFRGDDAAKHVGEQAAWLQQMSDGVKQVAKAAIAHHEPVVRIIQSEPVRHRFNRHAQACVICDDDPRRDGETRAFREFAQVEIERKPAAIGPTHAAINAACGALIPQSAHQSVETCPVFRMGEVVEGLRGNVSLSPAQFGGPGAVDRFKIPVSGEKRARIGRKFKKVSHSLRIMSLAALTRRMQFCESMTQAQSGRISNSVSAASSCCCWDNPDMTSPTSPDLN